MHKFHQLSQLPKSGQMRGMIATLPMYDFPELRAANEAWWAGIAGHGGIALPLSRFDDYVAAWSRPDLVFSQTCGYPFTHHFKGKLGLLGTPHYAGRGCDGPRYSSFVYGREQRKIEDYRGCTAAVNTPDSMSGMLALKLFFVDHARDGKFFERSVLSGGHLNSLAMVQRGEADVCAIDAVCVAYAGRYRPDLLHGLHEIGRTPLVPGLPYVSNAPEMARWQAAVVSATADPALAATRAELMISGFSLTRPEDYHVILNLEDEVGRKGGLHL